jgi:hypothetical protein
MTERLAQTGQKMAQGLEKHIPGSDAHRTSHVGTGVDAPGEDLASKVAKHVPGTQEYEAHKAHNLGAGTHAGTR